LKDQLNDLENENSDLEDEVSELQEKIIDMDSLRNYIEELDKDLNVYLRPNKRDLETVCYDLVRLVKG
jgi:cell division protein FtsB